MKPLRSAVLLCALALGGEAFSFAADLSNVPITGSYVETRSAEVFAGPCLANSEMNLVGDQAIMAWHISRGSWEGVPLDGLGVAAAIKASGTIGAPESDPYPAKAVLLIDERATAEQRHALKNFAKARAGRLLDELVSIVPAAMGYEQRERGVVLFTAGDIVRVETRNMQPGDHLCGNEELCYLPLTRLSRSMPVFTLMERFTGQGLGVTWSISGKTSSFVGNF